MQHENRITLAEELFAQIAEWKFPADKFLNDYFRTHRFVGSKDRRFLYDEIYAKIRGLGDCPKWLMKYFPKDFDAEIAALNGDAPTDLRVNSLKAMRSQVKLEAEPTPVSKVGLRLSERQALQLDGRYEIQDEGSQLACNFAGVKPGERVLDYCAGAGGKTLQLAAEMQNKGEICVYDTDARKLKTLATRAKRAGVKIIASGEPGGLYDLVLADAPCSGTGTWRRQPDAKWRLSEEKLKSYVKQQKEILENAKGFVKPGGRLVYITCSLLPVENEERIVEFLKANPGFKNSGNYLRLSPLKTNTDGFFAAMLVKT